MLRWARPNRALFSTFFTFLSKRAPNCRFLTPFLPPTHADVVMRPRACFRPFHRPCSMRLPAPDCQNGSGKRGLRICDWRFEIFDWDGERRTAAPELAQVKKGGKSRGKAGENGRLE